MTPLLWIIVTGLLMSLIAFIGGLTFFLNEKRLSKVLHFFVALAAGTLLGGAIFHLLPLAIEQIHDTKLVFLTFACGFTLLLFIEQILLWHAVHQIKGTKRPLGDFGILVESGWTKKNALLINFLSALTFPIGGLSFIL